MTYTSSELLTLVRQRLGLSTTRADASVAEWEGVDTDALLRQHMRSWYLHQLDTAPPALLSISEIARQCSLSAVGQSHHLILLPSDCRRVLAVQLQGWQRHVQPVCHDSPEGTLLLRRLASPYARPGTGCPSAIMMADGRIAVAPVDIPAIQSVRAIVDPGPDSYVLCPSLLDNIDFNATCFPQHSELI
ncbi:MAG: hypothetical protein K2L77_08615 [Muribaculaceae bacterium]|nr:hypothetical protein [Muribaculaceae bacterium]